MDFNSIIIRFGELSLKGKNKINFINQLHQTLKVKLSKFWSVTKLIKEYDRMFLEFSSPVDTDEVEHIISNVLGIYSFSWAIKVDSNLDVITKTCINLIQNRKLITFKLDVRRSDKKFPATSTQIKQYLAPFILSNTSVKVDLENPQEIIFIELRKDATYVFVKKTLGAGGLPVGASGRGLVMISGGIDSPVSSFLAMKRGLKVEYVHFITPPQTSEMALNKVKQLVGILNKFSNRISDRLHIIDFSILQYELMHISNPIYRITLMRRMFYRISELIAKKLRCEVIINGESLGQVASQTIDSIATIGAVVKIPVLRPLICFDKSEIIQLSQKIGTYDTSVLPFDDCCSLFVPKSPVTHPHINEANLLESEIMWEELIDLILEKHWTTCSITGPNYEKKSLI